MIKITPAMLRKWADKDRNDDIGATEEGRLCGITLQFLDHVKSKHPEQYKPVTLDEAWLMCRRFSKFYARKTYWGDSIHADHTYALLCVYCHHNEITPAKKKELAKFIREHRSIRVVMEKFNLRVDLSWLLDEEAP